MLDYNYIDSLGHFRGDWQGKVFVFPFKLIRKFDYVNLCIYDVRLHNDDTQPIECEKTLRKASLIQYNLSNTIVRLRVTLAVPTGPQRPHWHPPPPPPMLVLEKRESLFGGRQIYDILYVQISTGCVTSLCFILSCPETCSHMSSLHWCHHCVFIVIRAVYATRLAVISIYQLNHASMFSGKKTADGSDFSCYGDDSAQSLAKHQGYQSGFHWNIQCACNSTLVRLCLFALRSGSV